MVFSKYNDMVKEIAACRSNPALSDGVLPRRAKRRILWNYSETPDSIFHSLIENGIVVKDQVFEGSLPGKCIPQLLNYPRGKGMKRNIEMQNSPGLVMNQKETIERSKAESLDCEEIHGDDFGGMIPEESQPPGSVAFQRWGIREKTFEIPADRCERNVSIQKFQFSLNASWTPGVFRTHLLD